MEVGAMGGNAQVGVKSGVFLRKNSLSENTGCK